MTAFRFVDEQKAVFPIATMCRVLEVSSAGYFEWRKRGPSDRARRDQALTEKIREAHGKSRGTYGSPRMHAELKQGGERCGRKRVARLMCAAGLRGVHRRRRVRTTRRDNHAAPAPDLLKRDFTAPAPDRKWVADITYVPTWMGFLYLAVVLDCFSRRVVGWAMAAHMRVELVLQALDMAVRSRRPGAGVIHHSDRGSQYTAVAFGLRCQQVGVVPSMGSVGDAYDNALCESFFASLETELIDRSTFRTHDEARTALFDYIEVFYNRIRRHSSLGYGSPAEFERRYHRPQEDPESAGLQVRPGSENGSTGLTEPLFSGAGRIRPLGAIRRQSGTSTMLTDAEGGDRA